MAICTDGKEFAYYFTPKVKKKIQCNVQSKLHSFTMLDLVIVNCCTSLIPTIRNYFPFYFNSKCRLFVLRTRTFHTTNDHHLTKRFDMVKE
jgi:hypothetical protein